MFLESDIIMALQGHRWLCMFFILWWQARLETEISWPAIIDQRNSECCVQNGSWYPWIIIITIYFKNVHFFHAQLESDVFPDMRPLHISLTPPIQSVNPALPYQWRCFVNQQSSENSFNSHSNGNTETIAKWKRYSSHRSFFVILWSNSARHKIVIIEMLIIGIYRIPIFIEFQLLPDLLSGKFVEMQLGTESNYISFFKFNLIRIGT